MGLLSVEEALQRILARASRSEAERVPLSETAGRVLSADVEARLTQPPFNASAMDGYALMGADLPETVVPKTTSSLSQ